MSNGWNPRTKAVHAGTRRSQYGEVSEAIFLTQGFVYDTAEDAAARFEEAGPDEFIYARYGNPTVKMFEDRVAALEGVEDSFATASGMAAVSGALMSMLKVGDKVVSSRALFGSCLYVLENILTRYGVDVTFVDGTNLDEWKQAITSETDVVFFESMSNPTLEVIDIKSVSEIAHANGALVVVDNVFATPVYSNAFAQGADVIVYSTTKHIDGQGRALGGIVLGSRDYIRGTLEPFMKHTGGSMSPFTAWLHLKGLETMDLRVRAQTTTAHALATRLQGHAALERVIYPGLTDHPQSALVAEQMGKGGTMLAIELKGGRKASFKFLNAAKIAIISNNLGDAKTILTHPATTTHQRLPQDQKALLGITDGLVRISIGIEDTDDLIADILQAIEAAQ